MQEAGKRKLEIHLSTEVSEEQYNEIMMKLYAFVVALPISANDKRRLCGLKPVNSPHYDQVFIPLETEEERIKTISDNFADDTPAMQITFQATT